jgi:hypothetical protein
MLEYGPENDSCLANHSHHNGVRCCPGRVNFVDHYAPCDACQANRWLPYGQGHRALVSELSESYIRRPTLTFASAYRGGLMKD